MMRMVCNNEVYKRIGLCISLLILIIFVTSCDGDNKITGDSKETQIKKSFAKTLEMYPIKNLEDLYDKEGYRDGEFKKMIKVLGFCIQL